MSDYLAQITKKLVIFRGCETDPCQLSDLVFLLYDLVEFAYYIATVIFTAYIVYGAFYIIIFGSNPTDLLKGRKIIVNAAIGIALVFGAFIIVNTLFQLLGFNCQWYRLGGCSF